MSDSVQALRQRLIGTIVPVSIGAALGFYYWKWFVSEGGNDGLAGAYSAAGAAGFLLFIRVLTIGRMMAQDFFSKDS